MTFDIPIAQSYSKMFLKKIEFCCSNTLEFFQIQNSDTEFVQILGIF